MRNPLTPLPLSRTPQIGQGLQEIKLNDQHLDQHLDQLSKGLTRLRTIAADQRREIQLQEVIVDRMGNRLRAAADHVDATNSRLQRVRRA
jgi:hypothetical protein